MGAAAATVFNFPQGLEGSQDWMGDEEEPLVGFSWRGGFERDTTGILMWSQPFVTTLPSGEEARSN